jgi:hypothetical protein
MDNTKNTRVTDMEAAAAALKHLKDAADVLQNAFGNYKSAMPAGNMPGMDAETFGNRQKQNPLFNPYQIQREGADDKNATSGDYPAFDGYEKMQTAKTGSVGTGATGNLFGNSNAMPQPDRSKLNREFIDALGDRNYVPARGNNNKKQDKQTRGVNDVKRDNNLFSSPGKPANRPIQGGNDKYEDIPGKPVSLQNTVGSKGTPGAVKQGVYNMNKGVRGPSPDFSLGNNLFGGGGSSPNGLFGFANKKPNADFPSVNMGGAANPFSARLGGAPAASSANSPFSPFRGPGDKADNLFTTPAANNNSGTNNNGGSNKIDINVTGDGAKANPANANSPAAKKGISQSGATGTPSKPPGSAGNLFSNSGKIGSPAQNSLSKPVDSFNKHAMNNAHAGSANKGTTVNFHTPSSHNNVSRKHSGKQENDVHSQFVSILLSAVADSKIGTDVH